MLEIKLNRRFTALGLSLLVLGWCGVAAACEANNKHQLSNRRLLQLSYTSALAPTALQGFFYTPQHQVPHPGAPTAGLMNAAAAVGSAAVAAVARLVQASQELPNAFPGDEQPPATGVQQVALQPNELVILPGQGTGLIHQAVVMAAGAPTSSSSSGSTVAAGNALSVVTASPTTAAPGPPTTTSGTVMPTSSNPANGGIGTSTTGGITVSTSTPVTVYNPINVEAQQQTGAAGAASLLGAAQNAFLLAAAARPRVVVIPVFLGR